jgi:hypothetical protein
LAGDYDGAKLIMPQCTFSRCANLLSRCEPNAIGIATTNLNDKVEDIVSWYERYYCKRTRQEISYPPAGFRNPSTLLRRDTTA